jgi:hypothetical protein
MLFRRPGLHKHLPVSDAYKHAAVGSEGNSHPLGRRQLVFERSQAHREKLFENGIQMRRRMFSVNEAKREAIFAQQQRLRQNTAAQQEHDRSIKFVNAQNSRRRLFQDAERSRTTDFHDAEDKRAEAFKSAQASRHGTFSSTQAELRDQCFESETRRTSEFEEWTSNLLSTEEREQTEGYKEEEMEREATFMRAVNRSTLTLKGGET